MINRYSTLALVALAVLGSTDAFASRAREIVMGQADPFGILDAQHGSFYYDDNYNIFYNPSYANDFKNWATIEKTNGNVVGKASQAEGGFVANAMNFNIGFFMNRTSGIAGTYGTPATSGGLRPFDVILAGDMGVKWGVGVTHGDYKAGTDLTASETDINLGVQVMDFEPFARFSINGSDKLTAGTETKYSNFRVGTRYKYGEWVPFAAYGQDKVTTATETTTKEWGVGLGRSAKMTDTSTLNYAVSYWKQKSHSIVPINLSAEAELVSWLTGRAGLTYDLINRDTNGSQNSSVLGRVGASFNLGKVSFDWAVGGSTGGPVADYANVDGQTFDIGSGFFTNASMTYRW
jgi:hypothetical protein